MRRVSDWWVHFLCMFVLLRGSLFSNMPTRATALSVRGTPQGIRVLSPLVKRLKRHRQVNKIESEIEQNRIQETHQTIAGGVGVTAETKWRPAADLRPRQTPPPPPPPLWQRSLSPPTAPTRLPPGGNPLPRRAPPFFHSPPSSPPPPPALSPPSPTPTAQPSPSFPPRPPTPQSPSLCPLLLSPGPDPTRYATGCTTLTSPQTPTSA